MKDFSISYIKKKVLKVLRYGSVDVARRPADVLPGDVLNHR